MIASRASPRPQAAGITAPCSQSSDTDHRVAHPRRSSALVRAVRNHPRTVLAGRSKCRAIRRCPYPQAASQSAWPITCALSRRRGTSHAGASTCVTLQQRQRARAGVSCRTPASIRTSRKRAYPHGESGPEQPGQASKPAASAACACCSGIAIESIEGLWLTHGHQASQTRSRPGRGRWCCRSSTPAPSPARSPAWRHDRHSTTVNSARVPSHDQTQRRSTADPRPRQTAGLSPLGHPDSQYRFSRGAAALPRPRNRAKAGALRDVWARPARRQHRASAEPPVVANALAAVAAA